MCIRTFALIISLTIILSACGVKGPPLPPIATTPQQSEIEPRPQVSPVSPSEKKNSNE